MENTEKKFGFVVVGCGRMGQRRVESIVDDPRAILCAVFDTNGNLAGKTAAAYGCRQATSLEETLQDENVDCVVVCAPNKFHLEYTRIAVRSGKHVFCEEPIAGNLDDALKIVELAKESSATFAMASNLRYFPSIVKARSLLSEGAVGKPIFLRTWIGHGGWNLNSQSWFSDPSIAGGGTFLDNGCHVLDLTRWLLGEVASCIGEVQTSLWDIAPLEDNAVGVFRTEHGQTAIVQSSWTEWRGYNLLEIYGSDGYVRVDNSGSSCLTVLGNRSGEEQIFDFSDLPENSYAAEFESYLTDLCGGRNPKPDAFDGMRAVKMAWGVYESAKSGVRISLEECKTASSTVK